MCVMNARRIPECIESFEALPHDLAWMTGYTDAELGPVHQGIVESTDYDAYLVVSDDCVVTGAAVDAVLELLEQDHPAATGWCKLHQTSPYANLCRAPLKGSEPKPAAYPFYRARDVQAHESEIVPTHFMGFALTGMPREMWQRYPYGAYTARRATGYSSDFHLCVRLRDDGVPMVAARDGYVEHLKTADRRLKPRSHRLLVGEIDQEVRLVERAAA